MKSTTTISAILLSAVLLIGCSTQRGFPPTNGLANFDSVDGHLYRSGQPSAENIKWLKSGGITTIINLRGSDAWADEENACKAAGVAYFHIPMAGLGYPKYAQVEKAVRAAWVAQGKVLVHCQYGCERTGVVVAAYRIWHGMSNDAALNDANIHGISSLALAKKSFIKSFK